MLFTILYILSLVGFVSAGYFIAHRRYYKRNLAWKSSGTENAIISFYGLMLSFLLLMAGNASKERHNLIHQHADALASLHREAGLIPQPLRDSVRQQVVALLEEHESTDDAGHLEDVHTKYAHLWKTLEHASTNDSSRAAIRPMATATNAAIALSYRIEYSNRERTPLLLIALMVGGSWLVGLLVGFTNGFNEQRHYLVPIIFVVITVLMVLAIRDLNDPTSGLIRTSLDNYRELRQALTAQ